MLPNRVKQMMVDQETILDAFNAAYDPIIEYDIDDTNLIITPAFDPDDPPEDKEYTVVVNAEPGYGIQYRMEEIDGTETVATVSEGIATVTAEKRVIYLEIAAVAVEDAEGIQVTFTWTPEHTTGIFDAIRQIYDPLYDIQMLDTEYVLDHAAHKKLGTMVKIMLKNGGTEHDDHISLTNAQIHKLAELIWRKYGDAWDRTYDALIADYNPIHNYDRDETITYDLEDGHGASEDYVDTETEKRNTNLSASVTDATNELDVYGFNSTDPVPDSKQTTNSETVTSGDKDDNYTETSRTLEGKLLDTKDGTVRTITKGNIGVTTSAQMVDEEVRLRMANQMRTILMRDVDAFLTQPIYNDPVSCTILREEI